MRLERQLANQSLPAKEPYHLEKDLETKSVRAAFDGYEIRTPEIEALLNGKVLKVDRPESSQATASQFLDKFQKVESPALSSGFSSGFASREEPKIEAGHKAPLQIEKPPGSTQTKSSFPTFKNRTGKSSETSLPTTDLLGGVSGGQITAMDVDLLGGTPSFVAEKSPVATPDIDFRVQETSFAPSNLPRPSEGDFKVPKSKVLSLKSRIDRPPQDDSTKKTAYFGSQNQQKNNGFDDFFS